MRDESYTIQQLATHARVSVATVRKYRERKLIRAPYGSRCAPIYTNDHLRDLMRIRDRMESNVRLSDLDPPTAHVIKVSQ